MQIKLFDDGGDIAGPIFAVLVGSHIIRLARLPVAPGINGYQPKFVSQGTFDLGLPRKMTLHEAMNEQDSRAGWVAPFPSPQLYPTDAFDLVFLAYVPLLTSRQICASCPGPPLAMYAVAAIPAKACRRIRSGRV